MVYRRLDHEKREIRLITILPPDPHAPESAPLECRLEEQCLHNIHFTAAYKRYLDDKNAPGAWHDPRAAAEQALPEDETGDWVRVERPDDNATTHLPAFRYKWGDFMALSYTWGDPTQLRAIRVNGQPLAVTKNVEACLRVLRGKPYVRAGWRLWIDAICIDQKNVVERASEVKRMREIYTKAWTPLIWLGESDAGSEGALELVLTLAREYASRDGVEQLTRALHQNSRHFGEGRWRALNDVVCRRYWRRLWVLQEAALGRDTMPVLCGDRTLSWCHFARAFDILTRTDEVINTYITDELKDASREFDLAIWPNLATVTEIEAFQKAHHRQQSINIYRLLDTSRAVFATDPRDKVYGLLALMDENLASLVQPDYTDTVLNVYGSFALATIEATDKLDIIRHAGRTSDPTFPSWVPDWTEQPKLCALTMSDSFFTASGASVADLHRLADPRLLSCKGFIVDRFDGLGCMWAKGWSPESVVQTQGTADPYGSLEGAREAFGRASSHVTASRASHCRMIMARSWRPRHWLRPRSPRAAHLKMSWGATSANGACGPCRATRTFKSPGDAWKSTSGRRWSLSRLMPCTCEMRSCRRTALACTGDCALRCEGMSV